jgi:hypothetical protein
MTVVSNNAQQTLAVYEEPLVNCQTRKANAEDSGPLLSGVGLEANQACEVVIKIMFC